MPSKKTFLLLLLLLLAFVCGGLWLFVERQQAARMARFTAETRGVITGVEFTDYRTGRITRERIETVVDENAGKRRRTTHIRYRYTVGNREIESETFNRGDRRENYAVGMERKVCYDPRFPEESVLVELNAACGGARSLR
jgi:hypothetical protein